MQRVAELVRALDRLARERGWSRAEMAAFVGLSRSTLVHAAGGRRVLTTQALIRISRALPELGDLLKDLYWTYIRYEAPLGPDEVGTLPASNEPVTTLPERDRDQLQGYVRAFPQRFVEGRGLVVVGRSAAQLSAAASLVSTGLTTAGLAVARRPAKDRVHASEVAPAARARLLVLERVDFMTPDARTLLVRRLEALLPFVLTTASPDLEASLGEDLASAVRTNSVTVTFPPPVAHA